jgi:pimeloyl-ACP methyl ester carboxylesterase
MKRTFPLLMLLAAALAAGPVRAAPAWTGFTFKSAFGDEVAAERTIVIVPENRARPGGGTIRLPAVRFRSLAARPGPPIVYLAGGPGLSGIERGRQELFPLLMRLREVADVILFDQRGTGAAEPSLALPGSFDLPAAAPLHDPAVLARLGALAAHSSAVLRQRGVDLAAYDTIENAEDFEALRIALAAPKIALWGHSYGSHLGLQYIGAHPDRVVAAILGGVNDLPNRWRLPADGDAWLAHIDAAVRAQPRLAGRMPDFLGTVRRVMGRLDERPVTVDVDGAKVLVGREELRTLMAVSGGELEFVRSLPFLFARMDAGDFARVARMVRDLKATPLGTGMRHAMHIASGVSPARLDLIRTQLDGSLMGDAINFPYNVPAFVLGWGVADLGEGFRAPRPSDVPVLFMNGEFDGRTSVREARETAARFSRGAFVEVLGASHDFYTYSPAVLDAMIAFLKTGARPPERIVAIATEFWSPDEADQLDELQRLYRSGGAPAAVARMREMAAATSGPLFSAPTAKFFAFTLGKTLNDPKAALAVLEAADILYPDDFFVIRLMATFYRQSGDKGRALAQLERLKRLFPLAAGIDQEIRSLR